MGDLQAVFVFVGYLLFAGVNLYIVAWTFFTLSRTRRATEEILAVQREILRELRRVGKDPLDNAPERDDVARPPKQPFW
jgi:hypothetical protein